MLDIKHGLSQRSIIGPLLFIIYINDLPNASTLFNFLMYADDTTLYCCMDEIKSHNKETAINEELQHVNSWLISNKLSLNVNKTKYMLYFKAPKVVNHLKIKINNNEISRVNTFNFLGLNLSSNLTWHTHINTISRKILLNIGIL